MKQLYFIILDKLMILLKKFSIALIITISMLEPIIFKFLKYRFYDEHFILSFWPFQISHRCKPFRNVLHLQM